MKPVHDKYEIAPILCKVYGRSWTYWTPARALGWNATFLPASGSRDDGIEAVSASQAGREWYREEDVETWNNAEVRLSGSHKVARDAFSAEGAPHSCVKAPRCGATEGMFFFL